MRLRLGVCIGMRRVASVTYTIAVTINTNRNARIKSWLGPIALDSLRAWTRAGCP